MGTVLVQAIDQSDLTDRAYARLRQLILARRFQPNEKLSVDRLAEALGVSRTPVKDALRRLEADGLVTISRRVGTFVTPVTSKDIREIFEMRLLFETHAVEEGFPRVTADDIAAMQELVAVMARCIAVDPDHHTDMDRYLATDHAFHCLLISLARNDRLLAMYDALHVHIQMARAYAVREPTNVHQGQVEHEQIVAAYAARDLRLLKQTVRRHVTTVQNLVLKIVDDLGGAL